MREQMKEKLMERAKEQATKTTFSGSFFKQPIPEGMQFYKPIKGANYIDIIPFTTGPNHPKGEGEPHYVLEVSVHRDVGIDEKTYLCLKGTYGKPCPICEHQKQLKFEGADEDLIKSLNPKKREIYNVVAQTNDEEYKKGVQVFDVSYFYMGKYLAPLIKGPRRPGGGDVDVYVNFVSPDSDGKTVGFDVGSKTVTGNDGQPVTFPEYIGHRFSDRNYDLPDEFIDSAFVLDDLIYIPSHDEVFKAYWGEDDEEDKEEETKKASPRNRPAPKKEDPDPDPDDDEPKEKAPARKLKRPTPKRAEKEPEPDPDEDGGGDDDTVNLDDMSKDMMMSMCKMKKIRIKGMADMDEDDLRWALEDYFDEMDNE